MEKYVTQSQLGASYAIDIRRRQLVIDSRFRKEGSSTNFVWDMSFAPILNMLRLRVVSIEIPNVWNEFSSTRANLKFKWRQEIVDASGQSSCGCWTTVEIAPGNYTDTELIAELNSYLPEGASFAVDSSGHTTFTSTTAMDLDFLNTSFSLGYSLGFRQQTYADVTALTSESLMNVAGDNYILLDVNSINTLECAAGRIASAKIIMCVDKGSIQFNTGTNIITEDGGTTIFTSGALINTSVNRGRNLREITIRLLDPYGRVIDLNGMDWSMTIEIVEAVNPLVYLEYRRFLDAGFQSRVNIYNVDAT